MSALIGDDGGELRVSDLMAAAAAGPASAAASSIRSARKLLERMEKQATPLAVPLPRTVAERVERQAGYEDTKQDVTKWQPIVKVCGVVMVMLVVVEVLIVTAKAALGAQQAV